MAKLLKYLKNYREHSVKPEVDTIRGIFPFLSNSGYVNLTSNGVFASVLLVPSGHRYILQAYWVNNSADANYFILYDAAAGSGGASAMTTLPPIQVAQSKTDIVTGLAIPFQSGVFVSCGPTGLTLRVWGILIASEVI